MSRRVLIGVTVAMVAVLVGVSAGPVLAAPQLDVHIESDATIGGGPDPFTASGPAVDAGTVCANGTTEVLSTAVSGPPGGSFSILHVDRRFTCDDGTFDMKKVVNLDLTTGDTTARWKITGGTGAYAGLKGRGSLVGTPIVVGSSIHDVYDGQVH